MKSATDPLSQYLRDFAARPYEIGQTDCARLVVEWVAVRMARPELAARWSGYRSKAEGLRRHGARPMGAIIAGELEALGWQPAEVPAPGDILADRLCGIVVRPGAVVLIEETSRRLMWHRLDLSNLQVFTLK